jgi:hypothetical protein
MAAYTLAVACLFPLALIASAFDRHISANLLYGHFFGCFLSGFVANALVSAVVKR